MSEGTYRPPSRRRWLLSVMVGLFLLTILVAWALMQSRAGHNLPESMPASDMPTALFPGPAPR